DDTYRVRVVNNVFQTYSNGTGASATPNTGNVNKTWFVSHETSTPVSATLKLGWAATQQGETFRSVTAYVDHYNTTTNTWDGLPANKGSFADDGQLAVQRTGISSFSPFAVTSNAAGPLPVRLVAFGAQRSAATVVCTWTTASEQNSSHFTVERSLAGAAFEALGTLNGQGTQATAHTYSFVDERPAAGLAYYRLRQVDTDGTATYSPVVAVAGAAAAARASLAAAPNPSAGLFELLTTLTAPAQVELAVYNTLGQPVLTTRQALPAGSATLPLDLRAQPAGVYVVRLQGATEPLALRLLKQ
ncbi:MAG: T9SS type A sorting domain-containing protein, partial [Hymenobacter sp.]